ncbi:MAG: hypothetical protein ACTSSI_18330 [Candidatus Helarchaeota archaeon]
MVFGMIIGITLKILFYFIITLILSIVIITIARIGGSEGGFGLAFGSAVLILGVYWITDFIVSLIVPVVLPYLLAALPLLSQAASLIQNILIWVITAFITFCVMWAIYCKTDFDMSGAGGFFAAIFTAIIYVIAAAIFSFMFLSTFNYMASLGLLGPDVTFWFNFI